MKPKVMAKWLGQISYREGLRQQRNCMERVLSDNQVNVKLDKYHNYLLLLEHYPVYTVGIRSNDYSKMDKKYLVECGAEFYQTDRGGLITFHGPGQLVVYPILNLKCWNKQSAVRWYVGQLELCLIEVCNKFSITAGCGSNTGVWINDNRKIAAIGIHVSRQVTSHGIALNCSTNLEWFDKIVPCGIVGKGVTSISKELKQTITTKDVIPIFLESFAKLFDCYCNLEVK